MVVSVGGGVLARSFYASPTSSSEETSAQLPPFTGSSQEPPGRQRVVLEPGARQHPDSTVVRNLLQRHFDAINQRNYQQWRATVVRAKSLNQPYGEWRDEYESTRDGSVTVHRIVRGPDGTLRVLMSLVSVQDREDAPKDMPLTCLRWRVVYQLVVEEGELRLGQGLPDSSLHNKCEN
ncbi:hypothetical protein CEP50_06745 [Actinopolyspora mortivallis]|uniref:Uncharacterized protein n=1 Tax=Actinopolyspora mortivallis TaxID=33906 RepID=A0A2T0GYQ7_ACTMO|nr:hypothetical protein CEP50_06745 [Actinopolyspora mortivallis]